MRRIVGMALFAFAIAVDGFVLFAAIANPSALEIRWRCLAVAGACKSIAVICLL